MRKKFTNYLLATFLFLTFTHLNAQDNVTFKVNAPSSLAATYTHGPGFLSTQPTGVASANSWGGIMSFGQVITGDVVVMRDNSTVDSVSQHSCNLTLKSGLVIKDKVVLIRRGTCGFSIKAYNAWKGGAKAVIIYNNVPNLAPIGLGATRPQADSVNIPVISVSRETGEALRTAIDGGTTVNITLRRSNLFSPVTSLNFSVPLKEALNTEGVIGINIANADTTTAFKLKPFFTATITEPDGKKVIIKGGADTLRANTSDLIISDSSYRPSKIGLYKITYTNSLSVDSLIDSFRITNHMFAQDKGVVDNWVTLDSASFVNGGLKIDVGHIYYTGINPDKATHAAFAIHNPADFPKNDEFILALYPYTSAIRDKNNNGTLSYDDLNNTEVGLGIYKIKGTEKPDSLLFVEFNTPASLKDTDAYILMLRYDGSTAGTGRRPQFTSAGNFRHGLVRTDIVVAYDDAAKRLVFYNGGWGGIKNIVRMYMQGFTTSLDKNFPVWAENSVNVFPNPINDGILNIDFKLEKLSEDVSVSINDVMGRVLKTVKLKNVQNGVQQINISELDNGFYFAKIVGNDGWRTKVFNVAK